MDASEFVMWAMGVLICLMILVVPLWVGAVAFLVYDMWRSIRNQREEQDE